VPIEITAAGAGLESMGRRYSGMCLQIGRLLRRNPAKLSATKEQNRPHLWHCWCFLNLRFLVSLLRCKIQCMEYIELKSLNRKVPRIGLGTWSIGGWIWGGTDEREALRTIRAALDYGINLLDTAPAYGFGHSEGIVAQFLAYCVTCSGAGQGRHGEGKPSGTPRLPKAEVRS
jgi:hypothetical protein